MIRHIQTQLDGTRGHREVVETGLLRFPSEATNLVVLGPSDSSGRRRIFGMLLFGSGDDHRFGNRINQAGSEQRRCVSLADLDAEHRSLAVAIASESKL